MLEREKKYNVRQLLLCKISIQVFVFWKEMVKYIKR